MEGNVLWAQVVACMAVFGLGLSFSLLGSVSVKLMPRLKIDQGGFGTLISIFMFTCMIAQLVIGVAVDKFGFMALAIVGFVALALAIFLIARAASFGVVAASCLLLGIGAMCLNTAGNVLGPKVIYPGDIARASNLLNVFFGLGLFVSPMLLSFLFRSMSYEGAVSVLGVIALVPVIFAAIAGYPPPDEGFTLASAASVLAQPAVIVAALVLFCYIALEVSMSNWIAPYGKEIMIKGGTTRPADEVDATAQRMLSVFAVAMMLGRFTASQLPNKMGVNLTEIGPYVIAGAALVAAIVIFIMTRNFSAGVAWVLVFVLGLAFAPNFPTIVGVTFSKFTPAIYGSIFGVMFAVGLLGAVIIPKAIGNWAAGSSVQQSLKILIVMCVILLVLAIVLGYVPGSGEFAAQPAATAAP